LITERKLSASTVNLAFNALRAFYHGLLSQDVEALLVGIKRPPRRVQPPRVFSAQEIEQLLTVGTAGDPLARAFLMTVFGGGLRLSEATHVQIEDIDAPRRQLRVSHPKGGRERITLLSPVSSPNSGLGTASTDRRAGSSPGTRSRPHHSSARTSSTAPCAVPG
jgi:site-specific recombinase XerD